MQALFAGGFNASTALSLPTPPLSVNDYFWYVTEKGSVDNLNCPKGSLLSYEGSSKGFTIMPPQNFTEIQGKSDEATRWATFAEVTDKPDLVVRDDEGDIDVRMVHSSYPTQSVIPEGAGISFRVNSKDDNLTRFADRDALIEFLATVKDSTRLSGKTFDEVKTEARKNLVLNTLTINKKPLNAPVELNAADVGLGNLPNYSETSSPSGTSTTLLATQRCAYEASSAPRLADERKRPMFYVNAAPAPDAPDGIYVLFDKSARTFTMSIKHEGIMYAAA